MAETIEPYMSKTRADYGSVVTRPKIEEKDSFELKGQFIKELRTNTFSGSDHEDANKHIEKVLEIMDLFHIPNIFIDQVMLRAFPMSLTRATSRWLRNRPTSSITTWEDLMGLVLSKILPHSRLVKSTKTSDGLAAIRAQLNKLGREIKKVNEKVYAAQVGCEQCKGPHYTKDCPLKEEGKTLEEAYYMQFDGPFQGGGYRETAPESEKRHEENSNLIKEIRPSMDAAIRNQGASIKTLEIQIGQISDALQEKGFESLSSFTETNPRDHVKLISTIFEADASSIRRIGSHQYVVSTKQNSILMYKTRQTTILFPSRLNDYYYKDKMGSYGP
ncbi:hypothetical protein Tco_1429695 [Tanacetum coccineum]